MRRVVHGILAIITIGLLVMAIGTDQISRTIHVTQSSESSTEEFQYIEDDPLTGGITLSVNPVMYESTPTRVRYNISITILSNIPMNITIDFIEFLFTPRNYSPIQDSFDIPRKVGIIDRYGGILSVVNASSITMSGSVDIIPEILEGWEDIYLGCLVGYDLRNHSLIEPNFWSSTEGGAILMIPVDVIPAILRPEGWTSALSVLILVWCAAFVYFVYGIRKENIDQKISRFVSKSETHG